jgi:hypothetical protein
MSLKIIKSLVDELTALHNTLGVQPSELIDNIFEDCYLESTSKKTADGVVFEITFYEDDENDRPNNVTMRYTYNRSRYLVLIEQKIASKRFGVQWDRCSCIQSKLEKLESLLGPDLPKRQIAAIMATMPKDFLKLSPKLQLVA